MGRIAWVGAGIVVATLIAIVVNLATSGGAWWLWPILAVLTAAAIAIEIRNMRAERSADPNQEITATDGAQVVDSPQVMNAPNGGGQQKIVARRRGVVRGS